MWLRLALKSLTLISILSACSASDVVRQRADRQNYISYTYHYRNLDSVEYYSRWRRATMFSSGGSYGSGDAETHNNLAFAYMAKMDYKTAEYLLNLVPEETDNQLELLIGYVQQMRLCQRQSRNKDFYDYREKALTALSRINEERHILDDRQRRRLLYGETELAIVTSTYYYYVGLEQQSAEALKAIDPEAVKGDTAQFLNYLYNIGAGGIITEGSAEEIYRQEMDHLLRCYQIALRGNYPYFVANALEGIAEHIIAAPEGCDVPLALVGADGGADGDAAISLAGQALQMFQDYGDVYQTAGAYRTLASCCRAIGDYEAALHYLLQSLADTTVMQAPDLVASIYEQLSVAYAAVDDKPHSDEYRNLYLDLQEQTRQDRQLEARAGQLSYAVNHLNWILLAVVATILLLVLLLVLFWWLGRRRRDDNPLEEQIEEHREQLAVSRRHVEEGERRHLEQRAKISFVNSLLPLIDRMVYAVNRGDDCQYILELIDKIEADNELLTQWIQLRQGQLNLHIESFPLQPLFDMIVRSQKSFQMKGVSLQVTPTEAVVKADRILTLFMLNTLADNARKFTPEGGSVTVVAAETADYVELSVADTGIGMTADELAHVFDRKVITDHGFGLLNCKGIIERYRKMSQLFSVCTLQAESQEGRGSRFFFRLPKGVARRVMGVGCWVMGVGCWVLGVGCLLMAPSSAQADNHHPSPITHHPSPTTHHPSPIAHLARAAIYADSAYFSNINGTYERTLLFADSCRYYLNAHYQQQHPHSALLMQSEHDASAIPPEIQWLHDSIETNYNLILDIRNESAVAALALHQWALYHYNNRVYTQLYKELSADRSLADYCRTMQQTKENRTVAVILLLLTLAAVLPLWYVLYLRPRLNARYLTERNSRDSLEQLFDEQRRADLELQNLHVSNAVLDNCLSTLKHETMYYPSRIRQLIEQGDMAAASEVVAYYRELYSMLSLQTQEQLERVKLHLQRLDHDILGDPVLIDCLFDILRRITGQKQPAVSYSRPDDLYVQVACEIGDAAVSAIDRLLLRQIARDHGEATNRRACSVKIQPSARPEDACKARTLKSSIIIILPAYGKLQSNHS